jgi:hypothetical protein
MEHPFAKGRICLWHDLWWKAGISAVGLTSAERRTRPLASVLWRASYGEQHQYNNVNILNELEFAKISDVSNPDRQKGWSCKPIQHRDTIGKIFEMQYLFVSLVFICILAF